MDGLRGLAIVLVVLTHSIPISLLQRVTCPSIFRFLERSYGSGVELFCLISGFVLLRPFLLGSRQMVVSEYALRRVTRLWPPYLAAWVLGGVTVWFFTVFPNAWTLDGSFPKFLLRDWLAQAFMLNIGTPLYNGAWWFLSMEMVFCTLVPPLAYAAGRWKLSWVPAIVLAMGAAVTALWASSVIETGNFKCFPLNLFLIFATYLPCYVGGIIAARFSIPPWAGGLCIGSGLALNVTWSLYPVFNSHIGNACLFFGLISMAGRTSSKVNQFFGRYLWLWLGERAYSIFLVHLSAFLLVAYGVSWVFAGGSAGYYILSRLFGIPLALILALVLFTLVEVRSTHGLLTAGDRLGRQGRTLRTDSAEKRF